MLADGQTTIVTCPFRLANAHTVVAHTSFFFLRVVAIVRALANGAILAFEPFFTSASGVRRAIGLLIGQVAFTSLTAVVRANGMRAVDTTEAVRAGTYSTRADAAIQTRVTAATIFAIPSRFTVANAQGSRRALAVPRAIVGALLDFARNTFPPLLARALLRGAQASSVPAAVVWTPYQLDRTIDTTESTLAIAFAVGTVTVPVGFVALVGTRLLLAVTPMVSRFAFAFVVRADAGDDTLPLLLAPVITRFKFARIPTKAAVALAGTVTSTHTVAVAILQTQGLSAEIATKARFAITHAVVTITVWGRLTFFATGLQVARSTSVSTRAKTLRHMLETHRPVLVYGMSILNASTVSTAVRKLVLRGALGHTAVFSVPTAAACAETAPQAVAVAGTLVFAYFRLALLSGVVSKAVASAVKAMTVIAAVAVANAQLAHVPFPIFVTLAGQVGLADTVVAAVARASALGTALPTPAVAALAMPSYALAMQFTLFGTRGNLTRCPTVTGQASAVAIVTFAVTTARRVRNFRGALAVLAVRASEFIEAQAGGIFLLTDAVAMAHPGAQTLTAGRSSPVGFACTHTVDAQAVAVAVRFAVLLVAALAGPTGLADAHTVVAPSVGTSTNTFAHRAIWPAPTFVTYADPIIACPSVAVAIVRAQTYATILPGVTGVADALSSTAEPIHVAVFQMRTTLVAAVISTPWSLAFAHAGTASAMAVAFFWTAGQLATVFARKAGLAKAGPFVAVPVGTAVVRAPFDAAIDAAEATLAHAFSTQAGSVDTS